MSHENQIVNKGVEQSSTVEQTGPLPVPCPRIPITVRPGTMEDLPFIDALQKMHTKQVGWMPTKQFEGKIKLGHVLVAESDEATERRSDEGEEKDPIAASPAFPSVASSLRRCVASSAINTCPSLIFPSICLPGIQPTMCVCILCNRSMNA